jgi:hypothetical protein
MSCQIVRQGVPFPARILHSGRRACGIQKSKLRGKPLGVIGTNACFAPGFEKRLNT